MKTRIWLCAICVALSALALVACGQGKIDRAEAPRIEPLAATANSTGDFTVSRVFSSNMVLQRDEPIRIWGWADESLNGQPVTASFAGQMARGIIENGEWLVTFEEVFSASVIYRDMTITCGKNTIIFEDVLVGDVYMVIGQSNVAYSMATHCASHGLDINTFANTKAPIRMYYNTLGDTEGYPQRGTEEVCPDVVFGRGWWLPTADHVGTFSAIGYLFAQEIVEKTNGEIPIGIIEIDGNGQPIGSFMPNEVAGATDSDTYDAEKGIYVPAGVNGVHGRYMYNHYMYPYEKYALAGIVWYQGESDYAKATTDTYVNKFVALMEYMRSTHNIYNPDFPVYIVELPTIYKRPSDFTGSFHSMDLGYIRAEMGSIPQRLYNSYLAVSSDIFTDDHFWNNLHPNIKDAQAKRLADIAGSVCYGLTSLEEATGPILKNYAVSDDRKTITLTFDNVGKGLATADGGTVVQGFVAYDRVGALAPTYNLTATITAPNQITVTGDNRMYGVAYNCVMNNLYGREVNLCNSHGRIASAFTFSEMRMYRVRHEFVGYDEKEIKLAEGDIMAVQFCATADMVSIGTQLRKPAGSKGSITLSLYKFDTDYATSVAAKPLTSKTFTDFDDYSWIELTLGQTRTWNEGEYLLVLSDAADVLIQVAGAHRGQRCYRDGEFLETASLLVGITYDSPVNKVYGTPTVPSLVPETEPVPTTEPETQPVTEPETEPETLPATEPETQLETAPVTEPETSPATLPDIIPETEPVTNPETHPDTVPAVEETIESSSSSDHESTTTPALTETDAITESGCASYLGGMVGIIFLLFTTAGFFLCRRRERAGEI